MVVGDGTEKLAHCFSLHESGSRRVRFKLIEDRVQRECFDGKNVNVKVQPLPAIPKELFDLFDIHELEKYMTPEEIAKGGSN